MKLKYQHVRSVLLVKLPTGAWQYVTEILKDNLRVSIYNINAVDYSKLNEAKLSRPDLEFRCENL